MMKTVVKPYFLAVAIAMLVAQPGASAAKELLIYAGRNQSDFLGCFNCSKFADDSICNASGKGGLFSSGIFNPFSAYGSSISLSSPWNRHSSAASVPVLRDRSGEFFGYFTINDTRSDAVNFASHLKAIFDKADGNLSAVQRVLCEAINR